jgi:cbb3-type cytochrome c oxidase subunit III
MAETDKEHIDSVTGKATTGHVWDGVRELNNPLPQWWLWIFYATIIWSVGYWIVYPSWPLVSSYTEGVFGWKSRVAIEEDLQALHARRGAIVAKLADATPADIAKSDELLTLARAQGRVAFADNCAPCHGSGGGGARGYPNLIDDDWIWGGSFADIEQTIRYGVRSGHDQARMGSPMPAFGRDGILNNEQIGAVADFVRSRAALQVDAGHLLPAALRALGSRAERADQAVLVDFPNRRFYFFFIEIWPQEVYYFTGLLVLAALTLFLMNASRAASGAAISARRRSGPICSWRSSAGSRATGASASKRDAGPGPSPRSGARRSKHFLWLMVAWWTGGAWVLYFADAPTLVKDLATFPGAGHRLSGSASSPSRPIRLPATCASRSALYMCPWPRIQAALTDEYALNVTYRYDRGEPRHSFKKSEALRAEGLPAGDCIDCNQCVNVCPTGVDIRKGLQLGCIQCGLCIDACDNVMVKVGRPTGLINYDTDLNIQRRSAMRACLRSAWKDCPAPTSRSSVRASVRKGARWWRSAPTRRAKCAC